MVLVIFFGGFLFLGIEFRWLKLLTVQVKKAWAALVHFAFDPDPFPALLFF
jgi:hypothetical protein